MILGIGNDLVDCRRIAKSVNRFGARFLDRVFTQQEQTRMNQRSHHIAGYAKIFAMKEAVLKALGTGLSKGITWHHVEIFRDHETPPRVELRGQALDLLKSQTPPSCTAHLHVSVSDEWPYAQAFAMISICPTTLNPPDSNR